MELDAEKGAQQKLIIFHMELGSGASPLEGAQASFGRCWGRVVDPCDAADPVYAFSASASVPFLPLPQPHSVPQSHPL